LKLFLRAALAGFIWKGGKEIHVFYCSWMALPGNWKSFQTCYQSLDICRRWSLL